MLNLGDLAISLKSKFSETVEFNNMKQMNLSSKFVYNFYNNTEESIETEESVDKFLKNDKFNVPRYVELSWVSAEIKEELKSGNFRNNEFAYNSRDRNCRI